MGRTGYTIRKVKLGEADDVARDLEEWSRVPAAHRVLHVFRMSEEAYGFAGRLPADSSGRPRSTARVLRA